MRNQTVRVRFVFLFLLMFPVLVQGALPVTKAFDLDHDQDVDGSDLRAMTVMAGTAQMEDLAHNFGMAQVDEWSILTPKVMIINFNPILDDHGGARLTEYLNWNAVDSLVADHIADVRASSGGRVHYVVVENHEVDAFPVKADGFQYADDTYLECWQNRA